MIEIVDMTEAELAAEERALVVRLAAVRDERARRVAPGRIDSAAELDRMRTNIAQCHTLGGAISVMHAYIAHYPLRVMDVVRLAAHWDIPLPRKATRLVMVETIAKGVLGKLY